MGWELQMPSGHIIRLAGTMTIGRAPINHIALNDNLVSRRHTELQCESNRLTVKDLNSTNGTFLNNTPVTTPRPVQAGDILRVGNTIIQVRYIEEGGKTLAATPQDTNARPTAPGTVAGPQALGEAVRRPVLPKPVQVIYTPAALDPMVKIKDVFAGLRKKQ